MPMFVDLIACAESHTNAALDLLCKADHDNDDSMWREHENLFVRRMVELFTQRGLMRLDGFRDELLAWEEGRRHVPASVVLRRPAGAMERWTADELALVKLYLQSLPTDDWQLDDHMMVVDYLTQRYLPADSLRTEAEWLAVRASIMGRVQANMANLSAPQVDRVLQALPSTVTGARDAFGMSAMQRATMEFGVNRAAENVTRLGEDVRHRMRRLVAERVERTTLGNLSGPSLQTELVDAFAPLNRDWRRIAVTEAGEAQCQGFVASQPAGTRLKRVEQYRNVCAFCAKINGRVVTVVDPAAPEKDPDNEVWVGKNNVGRSSAPRKRVGDLLVEREPDEMWWMPAGLAHPHCRGRWVPVIADEPGVDPDFMAYLRETLGRKWKE